MKAALVSKDYFIDYRPTRDHDHPTQTDLRGPKVFSDWFLSHSEDGSQSATHWMMVAISAEESRAKCLKIVALKLCYHQNHLENLVNHRLLGSTTSFWFSLSGLGLRICISNTLQAKPQLLVQRQHFKDYCPKLSLREAHDVYWESKPLWSYRQKISAFNWRKCNFQGHHLASFSSNSSQLWLYFKTQLEKS